MLEYLRFNIGSYFGGNVEVTVNIKNGIVTAKVESIFHPEYMKEQRLSKRESNKWLAMLDALNIAKWHSRYENDMLITDGEDWSIDYKQVGKRCRHIRGYMAYPSCWAEFLDVMALISPVHTLNRFDRLELYYHNIDEIDITENTKFQFKKVKVETKDSIVIDRTSQKITLYDTLGTGCKITREYYVEEGVHELLDECEEWFGKLQNSDANSDELPQYKLKITNHRGEVVSLKGGFNRRELPNCYAEFADRIAEFISFYGMYGSLLNPNNYNKGRKGEEYIFCSVSFSTGGKTYYYSTEDESISIGDRVIVPVGADDAEKTVIVENIEYFTEDDLPMPLHKVKSILCKARVTPIPPNVDMEIDTKYRVLIKYIEAFKEQPTQGKWIFDKESKGTYDDSIQMPYIKFNDLVFDFLKDFEPFMDMGYQETLIENNLDWSYDSITAYDIENADKVLVIAFITAIIRAERFCDGILLKAINDGYMVRWLERLFSIK